MQRKIIQNILLTICCAALGFCVKITPVHAGLVSTSPVVTATTTCARGLSCGLVGYWTFDGKGVVNGRLMDTVGIASGTLTNISTSTFFASGIFGQGFKFDGYDDYIDIDLGQSLTTFTISFWWKNNFPQGSWPGNTAGLYLRADSFADASKTMRFYSTGGTSKIQLSSNSGGTSNLSSTFTEAQNTQYHNVIVYTPTLMKWYVNGVLISSVTPSVGTFDARRYMTIGGSRNAGQSVNGLMDEFRMYNRALPQDEVLTLYGQKNGFIGVSPRLTSTTTAPYGQCTNNLSCGLFNYWTFDGKDVVNGVFLDSSGAGNSLNATSISTSTFYAPGRVGQGIRMDGVDDVLVSQINTPFPASNQFAYSFWIRAPGLTSGSIISWGASRFCARNGTAMNCTVDGNTTGAASASAVWDGLWHHIVFVNDGNTQQIYKDGVLAGTATETLVTGAASIRIGNRPSSSSFLQADIDDVRIYGRLLSSTEALMLYGMGTTARGVSPKLTSTTTSPYGQCTNNLSCGLVGYWTFDGKYMSSGKALDLSGNGNTVSLSNISTSTFYAPGRFGQGFDFDGTNDSASAGSGTTLDDLPALTVSLWVKARTYGANAAGYLVGKSTTASGGAGWFLKLTQSNSLISFGANFSGGSLAVDTAQNTFTTAADMNRWVHIVATWDRTNQATGVKIYKNGIELAYSTQTNGGTTYSSDAALNLVIGDGGAVSSRQSNAVIDEVRVYNRVLSAAEVRRLYGQGK